MRILGQLILWMLLAVQLHPARAYPDRWVDEHLTPKNGVTDPPGLSCIDHPADYYEDHGPPTGLTKSITFTLKDKSVAVTRICPSKTYNLAVNLGESGHMFLTTTAGDLYTAEIALQSCGNGSRIATRDQDTLWTQSLAFSCAQLAGRTNVTLKVTYAVGASGTFTTNTATFHVNSTCYTITCTTPLPPPPKASPSPPPPSPSPKPTFPDCIGAALLPNPCPEGKSCYYNKLCNVTIANLTFPDCGNAAPLPNPWPRNKCCFYNQECKSECHAITSSKCSNLSIPACSVPGCGRCLAGYPHACTNCEANYTLNVDTKQCDCRPGFAGATTCTQCTGNTVSYGGKLPTAKCTACPTGRVADKAQTECVVASAWDHHGFDLTNRRWNHAENTIGVSNVAALKAKWTFQAGSDVTATPVIVRGRLYVPDWAGNLWCLDAKTGSTIWSKKISDLVYQVDRRPYPTVTSNSSIISRASPAVDGTNLVVPVMKKGGGYPYLLVLKTADGRLVWGKRLDNHTAAMLTQSPTVHDGYIYQGVSSLEELSAADPKYACCTFRGSMLKVRLSDGAIMWRTFMAPDNKNKPGGFSGNSVWGSSPSVDVLRKQVYIATGNSYELPASLEKCLKALGPLTPANINKAIDCNNKFGGRENYQSSILALDLDSGRVRWSVQLSAPGAWNGACMSGGANANCKSGGLFDLNSPDFDFGQAPMRVTACNKAGNCKQLVVAGQKSGLLWALSPDSGQVVWSTSVGPGGVVGGLQWGSAADGSRIYVANNNYHNAMLNLTSKMKPVVNYPTNTNQRPPAATDGGLAAAIDAYTGEILWTFANPTLHWASVGAAEQKHARSQAPMTVANDVVYYASMDAAGTLFMLDARTGKLLNSFETGMTCGCGPAVVDGKVYVGSGYANFGLGKAGDKLHMLSL